MVCLRGQIHPLTPRVLRGPPIVAGLAFLGFWVGVEPPDSGGIAGDPAGYGGARDRVQH
jgi:hypothetical protein